MNIKDNFYDSLKPALLKEMWQQLCFQIDNYIESIVFLYHCDDCLNISLYIHASCEGFYSRSHKERFCSVRVRFIYVATLFLTMQVSHFPSDSEEKKKIKME